MIPVNNGFNPYAKQLENYGQQSTQQSGQGVISITGGEETALNYALNPNTTALLISSDTNEMFMKGVDGNAITNVFRAFDIKEKMPNTYSRNNGYNRSSREAHYGNNYSRSNSYARRYGHDENEFRAEVERRMNMARNDNERAVYANWLNEMDNHRH